MSGMTFRDRNDIRVFMQNLRSWYLISASAQRRIWSMSLQIVPHLFRAFLKGATMRPSRQNSTVLTTHLSLGSPSYHNARALSEA
jgi:hypothetical protein